MRAPRSLAAMAVLVALLSMPALVSGQSAEAGPDVDGSATLARRPDGRLPLEGTPWRLRAYRWQGAERRPGPEVAARLVLSAGRLEASGGCTAFRGRYGAVGRAIAFDLRGLRENDCAEQTSLVQEAMVDGLRKASRFGLEAGEAGGELALYGPSGIELLRFGLDDVGGLGPSDWELVAYTVGGTRRSVDAKAGGNLSFSVERANEARRRASGNALGSTGCNGFRGPFFRQADVISFGELSITDAPCPAAPAEVEAAVISVLEATAIDIALPPERLVLTSLDTGDSLEYAVVPGLEGATWLLATGAGRERGGRIVTLKLEDGVAAGEGPCGPYDASYVTDGIFITFDAVGGAGDGSCSERRAERRLITALRNAVRVDRGTGRSETPRLALRDARGVELIAFDYPFSNR